MVPELLVIVTLTDSVTVTSGAAKALRVDDCTGSLVPASYADLLVVDGEPLADIALLQDQSRLHVILQGGRAYKDLVSAG